MTNKQLLKKILSDRHINVNFLLRLEIYDILSILDTVFNPRENPNSAALRDADAIDRIACNCNYIYYKSKGKNSRRIKRGLFKDIYEESDALTYDELEILRKLFSEETNLEDIKTDLEVLYAYKVKNQLW